MHLNSKEYSDLQPGYDSKAQEKIVLFANTAWYLFNFRLPLLMALVAEGKEVVLITPPDRYVAMLENAGFRVVSLQMARRSLNPLTELALLFRLFLIFREEKPDVVFNFTIKSVVYGSIAAKLSGVSRRINAIAGLGSVFTSKSLKARLLKPLVKILLKLSLSGRHCQLIVQNPDDADLIIGNQLVKSESLKLIKGSGVNGHRFRFSKRVVPDKDTPRRVLFASRLIKPKGIEQIVIAAKSLGSRYTFIVAGEPDPGNPESITDEDLQSWVRQGLVVSLGHVDEMSAVLADVDLIVLPSIYGEGVPRILIEAAATGLPLVAFDVPGCREIVIDNQNGFLVKKGDQQALEIAIEKIFDNTEQYRLFSEFSRRHFEMEFEEESVLKKTLQVIRDTKHHSR